MFPQLEALDLSGRGLRQVVDHVDPPRILPHADLLLDVLLKRFAQGLSVAFGVFLQRDERLRPQQTIAVLLGDDRGLQH